MYRLHRIFGYTSIVGLPAQYLSNFLQLQLSIWGCDRMNAFRLLLRRRKSLARSRTAMIASLSIYPDASAVKTRQCNQETLGIEHDTGMAINPWVSKELMLQQRME
jgi:hypothetical protein